MKLAVKIMKSLSSYFCLGGRKPIHRLPISKLANRSEHKTKEAAGKIHNIGFVNQLRC
jgi:hypothetical protein